MKTTRFILVILSAIMILAACDRGGEKATFTSAPIAVPAQATATSTSAPMIEQATHTPAGSVGSGQSAGGGEEGGALFDLSSLKADPQELSASPFKSYRLTVTWVEEPKAGSGTAAASSKFEVLHSSDPLAEQITFFDESAGTTAKLIHIDDKLYIETGEQWIEMSDDDASSFDQMFFDISYLSAGLTGDAKLVGEEDLGVPVLHYAFDKSVLSSGLGAYNKVKGDLWVMADNTVIQYLLTAEDEKATYSWNWLVSDFDADFDIEPPANVQAPPEDFPIMADATNRVSSGTIVTYQTDSDLKAAIDFHKENMPASNWTYDEANSMVSDQFATLVFTRQGQTAQVTLTPNGSGGVMVMANIGP